MSVFLEKQRYGKTNVRVLKVVKDPENPKKQWVYEMTVESLLEGDFETSYTEADNSKVIATDTQKQMVWIMAHLHPVDPPEVYGAYLAEHYINEYKHVTHAHVKIIQHRWTRMIIDGKPHPHSFLRDSEEKRMVFVTCERGKGISVASGIDGMIVLKSTGSAFYGFLKDKYTILKEAEDRILSTAVDCRYDWKHFSDAKEVEKYSKDINQGFEIARNTTMKVFAEDESASVQATMYTMGEKIIKAAPMIMRVSYKLPNRHYWNVDLSWFKDLKEKVEDVYAPQSDPSGYITATITRRQSKL